MNFILLEANRRLLSHWAELHSCQQFGDCQQGQLFRCSYLKFLHWMTLYFLHQMHNEAWSTSTPIDNPYSGLQPNMKATQETKMNKNE